MVIEALKTWKPGNPLDPATNVGALVDTQQMNTVLSYIEPVTPTAPNWWPAASASSKKPVAPTSSRRFSTA
jgi:hypothetical protein